VVFYSKGRKKAKKKKVNMIKESCIGHQKHRVKTKEWKEEVR